MEHAYLKDNYPTTTPYSAWLTTLGVVIHAHVASLIELQDKGIGRKSRRQPLSRLQSKVNKDTIQFQVLLKSKVETIVRS